VDIWVLKWCVWSVGLGVWWWCLGHTKDYVHHDGLLGGRSAIALGVWGF
jgi:hypothetical protein